MIRLLSRKQGIIMAAAMVVMVTPGLAYARNGAAEEVPSSSYVEPAIPVEETDGGQQSAKERLQAVKIEAYDRGEAAKVRLDGAKLKRCENQKLSITNVMTRFSDRGQKQLDLFTTIADRASNFYSSKGTTLENYDSLVANVNAKKAAAQSAVSEIAATNASFSCDSNNPHGVVDSFKTSLKQQISALKEYKTAVKNLIVGIKSAQTTTDSATKEREQ